MVKTTEKKKWQQPGVVFQPQVYQAMQRGIKQLVQAIAPTLGPLPRIVASQRNSNSKPELFDDGATIARRIIQLRNREEDMGAMLLRHTLWSLHESAGDGTATAAVLFDNIFDHGVRYITAGGNAMRLRRALESGCQAITEELERQTIRLHGKHELARLAEAISFDPEMGKLMGEIFDIIGEYGRLEIRSGRSLALEREYIEGMYWDGGILSRAMIEDARLGRAQLENPAVLISDLAIQEPQDLLPLLEAALQADVKSLLLVASEVSERALSLVLAKPNRERIQVVAVKSPALHIDARRGALEDLAIITGGRAFHKAAGDTLNSVKAEDLGRARRAWADPYFFGVLGGRGNPKVIRQHIASLRQAFKNLSEADDRKRAQERLGKLIGGAAVLWVGASTPLGVELRKELAERTAEAMRGAIRDGVVPGGGVALLNCRKVIEEKLHTAVEPDERAAYNILRQALEVPARTLAYNAGTDPSTMMGQLALAEPGCGFDIVNQRVVNMAEAGIFDSAAVVKSAIFAAVHGAALALTVDVLIHRANPPESLQTG